MQVIAKMIVTGNQPQKVDSAVDITRHDHGALLLQPCKLRPFETGEQAASQAPIKHFPKTSQIFRLQPTRGKPTFETNSMDGSVIGPGTSHHADTWHPTTTKLRITRKICN
jgi:hypothetical protein